MAQKMKDEVTKKMSQVADVMERDIKGVQIGVYSVALLGLTIAIRKVRPFSKFKRPNDIPNHFIAERRELTGLVKVIEPNGRLLMIEHKPLVNLPIVPSGLLPVKISGVNVSGLGLSWLQAVAVSQEVRFVPVLKEKDFVQCEVLLLQKEVVKNKKQQLQTKESLLNLGERLVKIGFGTLSPIEKPLSEDPKILYYLRQLQSAEKYALRRKSGLKYYIKPTKNALMYLMQKLMILSRNLTQIVLRKGQKLTPA